MSIKQDNHMRHFLLIIGTILPFVSAVVYLTSILKKRTRPHRTTRLLLTFITGLSFASLLGGEDTSGVWLAGVLFAECVIVLVLSLRFGMGGRDPFDLVCLALCVVGIAAWMATGESLMGLLASIVADFLAMLPTLRKIWRHPRSEVISFYLIGVVAALSICLAGPYSWQSLLYPAYILLIDGLCVGLLWWRRTIDAPALLQQA